MGKYDRRRIIEVHHMEGLRNLEDFMKPYQVVRNENEIRLNTMNGFSYVVKLVQDNQ